MWCNTDKQTFIILTTYEDHYCRVFCPGLKKGMGADWGQKKFAKLHFEGTFACEITFYGHFRVRNNFMRAHCTNCGQHILCLKSNIIGGFMFTNTWRHFHTCAVHWLAKEPQPPTFTGKTCAKFAPTHWSTGQNTPIFWILLWGKMVCSTLTGLANCQICVRVKKSGRTNLSRSTVCWQTPRTLACDVR